MGEVVCTVKFQRNGQNDQRDLVMPDNVPIHQLVNSLARALRLPAGDHVFYELQTQDDGTLRRIPGSRTLQQAFILNGMTLYLSQEEDIPGQRAFLVAGSGLRFRLRETTIIGRLTPEVHVDIDLSSLDHETVVSRRHAIINKDAHHYLIKDTKSHNGTFVNRVLVRQGESVVIHSGDDICFGGIEKGVTLRFQVA
jgi:pSer/pThr/pTyr-binding forkhead associated (FHA) protein